MSADSTYSRSSERNSRSECFAPSWGVLLSALLAMLTLHILRLPGASNRALVWSELIVFALIPVTAFVMLKWRFGDLNFATIPKRSLYCFQTGALLVGAVVILWHQLTRAFGCGTANEIVALIVIQCIAWYLAVFSKVPGFEKTSVVLSGALVFFVGCIAEHTEVFVVAGLFAIAILWWLLGQYWSRLAGGTIDGQSRMLSINGAAIGGTTFFVATVALLVSLIPIAGGGVTVSGFMPFSGGRDGMQDRFARSGIGNGDLIRAGRNATTTGAVDSDTFIEGHKPSMYDVTSDQYNGPIVKKRFTRSVTMQGVAKHLHNAKESEKTGRTFRTMRESDKPSELEIEERTTDALFFIEGSVPARFAINTFDHFDGWDWSTKPQSQPAGEMPKISLEKRSGIPVYRIAQNVSAYLTGHRLHRVKMMRLETSTLPAAPLLARWHMDHADVPNLFRWSDVGLIRMDGEFIPPHAMIDVESFAPNYHSMRSDSSLVPVTAAKVRQYSRESRFLQLPENATDKVIDQLVTRWTSGIRPGWRQVEAIVDRMRNDFEANADWERNDEVEDTVGHFFSQNGGPAYMFATTCALALRKAGYQTRLTSGFLVQNKDFDWKSNQSIVTSENLHMWPEVCLDGKFWIPVEPTPGYPIPYSQQTAWQWITVKAFLAWSWICKSPLISVLCVAGWTATVLLRAELITLLMFSWWHLVKVFWPRGLLKTTRQLIDLRFSLAGDRRPGSATIGRWYRRVEPDLPVRFFDLWNASNFSDRSPTVLKSDLVSICCEPLNALPLKKIRNFTSTTKKA